jgi:hypothetical protein
MVVPISKEDAGARLWLCGLAAAAFLLEFIPNLSGGYGYFIDEFYYIACAKRLALGYVDHPPLAPLLLRLNGAILGYSIPAVRLLPALAAAATVIISVMMVRRLGGGRCAEITVTLAALTAPGFQIMFGMFTMNCFEIVIWAGCALLILVIVQEERPELWILFGLLAGAGLQNKHTMVLFGAGAAVGLVMTPARKHLASKWFWLGAGIASLITLPNIAWQIANGWPSLEFYRMATLYKNIPTSPLKGLANQLLFMNPLTLPLWGGGLYFFLLNRQGKPVRIIGWIFLTLLLLTLAARSSRPDRIAGGYPMLFAGGAVLLERLSARQALHWARWVLIALIAAGGALLCPIGLPILPPETLARYSAVLNVVPQIERGGGKTALLPQWFADRFGWEELVGQVADIYRRLPPEDQARTTIFAPSYGHAGAIELLGQRMHLPQVLCGHNNYYLWGIGADFRGVAIVIGSNERDLRDHFDQVVNAGIYTCNYCIRWRNNMPIFVARGARFSLREAWPGMKHFE